LKKVFGLDEFRPGQEEVVHSALAELLKGHGIEAERYHGRLAARQRRETSGDCDNCRRTQSRQPLAAAG
jgi:superfamily II DNA helicase RecQ